MAVKSESKVAKSESKALPVLVLGALCLAATYGVSSSASSAGDSEEPASEPMVSAMMLAKFMCAFFGSQFLHTYFFTGAAVKGYFTERALTAQEQKIAAYLMKSVGLCQLFVLILSVLTVASGTVSKEYMLTVLTMFTFSVFDVSKMTTTCEAVGIPKSAIYPFVVLCATMAFLSWKALKTIGDSEGFASDSFVSAMALAKFMSAFMGFQFVLVYFFTGASVRLYFTERVLTVQEQKVTVYLLKCLATNQLPVTVISVLTVASGAVSKEYMLTLALWNAFGTCAMSRMTTTCEAVGIPKSMLYLYMVLHATIAFLFYAAWKTM